MNKKEVSPCPWTEIEGPETLPLVEIEVHGFTKKGCVFPYKIFMSAHEDCWLMERNGKVLKIGEYDNSAHITHWRPKIYIEPPRKINKEKDTALHTDMLCYIKDSLAHNLVLLERIKIVNCEALPYIERASKLIIRAEGRSWQK
jgi:hypothetical protein